MITSTSILEKQKVQKEKQRKRKFEVGPEHIYTVLYVEDKQRERGTGYITGINMGIVRITYKYEKYTI